MKNKVSLTKLVSVLAFVFVFIFGIMSTNAWLKDYDDDTTKAGFVVKIGTVKATILGNDKQVNPTSNNEDLSKSGFELPTLLTPGSKNINQTIKVKNDDDLDTIYVRIKFVVICNGIDMSAQGYIVPDVDSSKWTKSSEWYTYKTSVVGTSVVGYKDATFCTTMSVSDNIPSGGVFQVIIVLEAASTAFTA